MISKKIDIIERLFLTIKKRQSATSAQSYTSQLLTAGNKKICEKVEEEALEVIEAAQKETNERVVSESADLLYHLLVLWASKEIEPSQIWTELVRREGTSGIIEKKSRKR